MTPIATRQGDDVERLCLLCKEGLAKAAIEEYHDYSQNAIRFVLAALIGDKDVLEVIRREMRRLDPGAKVSIEEIEALLPDVLKRDVIEGKSATEARRRVDNEANKRLRKRWAKPEVPMDSDDERGGDGEIQRPTSE